ncbi:MAG TPA: Rieske (2Fe-2S) protein [Candidatus Angelobacter sp.]|nr:Rieske (2Fe-2S) protein [Candidatus Angelobacter sp.]
MTLSKSDDTTLIKIGLRSDLPSPGTVKELFAAGRFLCLANVEGTIYATNNVCPHWGGPLGQGKIVSGKIVCPWHGWEFDPGTGETRRKLNARLTMHRVIVDGEDVLIEFRDET